MAKKIEPKFVEAQECFKVVDLMGNTVRVYDKETHGEQAETYAKEFADKRGYKVI